MLPKTLNGKVLISSKLIAKETVKNHGHIIRDIKEMLSRIDDPNLDHL